MTNSTLDSNDLDAVADAIQVAEAAEIAPLFRRLSESDVEEKSPGEIVTAADGACEAALSLSLAQIADAPIIGEEAVASEGLEPPATALPSPLLQRRVALAASLLPSLV